MKTIDDYKDTLAPAILLVGAAGSGKTSLAGMMPDPYIIDCDNNLRGPMQYWKSRNLKNVLYEHVNYKDGVPVDPSVRYLRMNDIVNEALAIKEVKTIVFDSCSAISDYIIADILRQKAKREMAIQDWGAYLLMWKNLVVKMRSIPHITTVFTAHERADKDELDQSIKYFVALSGQIAALLPTLFTDVWHCEIMDKQVGGKVQQVRQIRIQQNYRRDFLKHSLGIEITEPTIDVDKIDFSRLTAQ